MALVNPLDCIAVPQEIIIEFFAVFARCEYAMKETRYRRNDRGMASAAWLRFAKDAASWLKAPAGSSLEEAIALLRSAPPQRQTFENGWQAVGLRGDTEVEQAIDGATRVRHNLFHGGKHVQEAVVGRDTALVRAALTLLIALIERGPDDLRWAYNHP